MLLEISFVVVQADVRNNQPNGSFWVGACLSIVWKGTFGVGWWVPAPCGTSWVSPSHPGATLGYSSASSTFAANSIITWPFIQRATTTRSFSGSQ